MHDGVDEKNTGWAVPWKKMIIQYVILILNHFVMTAVGN